MSKFKNTVLSCCLFASAAGVQAGSTDGLSIAAVPGEGAASYTGAVKQFLKDYKADEKIDCGEYALNLENVYTNFPDQLTSELVFGAIKDKTRRRQLGKVLTGFRDRTVSHGFDAVLAYEVKGGQLRLYGISSADDIKVVTTSLPVAQARDQKKFNVAACKALASLPVLAEP